MGTGDDMDLIDRVAVATVRTQHQWEAREMAAIHEAVVARAAVDPQADAAVEATRAWATQAQAEEAARRAHWANVLAKG
jgi:hypothetical protein